MISFKMKSESRLMKLIASVLPTEDFMERYWTTIGSTIYVPTNRDDDVDWGGNGWAKRHEHIIEHEKIHVDQWERYTAPVFATIYLGPSATLGLPATLVTALGAPLWGVTPLLVALGLTLLMLPLSVGFAVGRMLMELEAFQPEFELAHYRWGDDALVRRIDARAKQLWRDYLWTMPPFITQAVARSMMNLER
jgi:hypothetical protein